MRVLANFNGQKFEISDAERLFQTGSPVPSNQSSSHQDETYDVGIGARTILCRGDC